MSDNRAMAESSSKTKDATVFPKKKKSVLKMMGEAVGKSASSYIDKTKNKNKTYPGDETGSRE